MFREGGGTWRVRRWKMKHRWDDENEKFDDDENGQEEEEEEEEDEYQRLY